MRCQKSVPVYLVRVGVRSQNLGCRRFEQGVQSVSIPDEVEELCDNCFSFCKSLPRVTFSDSSSFKLIRKQAFCKSGLKEIHIPDHVEELCDNCFSFCKSLSGVTFGESSSLKLFGEWIFHNSHPAIHIPDRVEEILIDPFANPQDAENSLLKLMTKTTRE